jgi:zinc transport system substrate-binding protein
MALLLTGCSRSGVSTGAAQKKASGKVQVVATIFPLADFARQVGGDRVNVSQLIPQGVEPHDWEPSPRDLTKLYQAQLVIYNGAGMEPWVDKVLPSLRQRGVKLVQASSGLDLLTFGREQQLGLTDFVGKKDLSSSNPGSGATSAVIDPHVWLDPQQAARIGSGIANGLGATDSTGVPLYQQRLHTFQQQLAVLDSDYATATAKFGSKGLVVSHAAFGYLMRRYRLHQVPVLGLSPEQEPDAETLGKLVDYCRGNDVRYIFFESLVSPRMAETIASEVGAQTLLLTPIDGLSQDEVAKGLDYFGLMRRNLVNISKALGEQ